MGKNKHYKYNDNDIVAPIEVLDDTIQEVEEVAEKIDEEVVEDVVEVEIKEEPKVETTTKEVEKPIPSRKVHTVRRIIL